VTGPINIGNPVEMTVRQLAEIVLAKTASASKLELRPLPTDDPRQRQPDIARARQLLGWEPKVPLDQGLEQTIAYFRQITDAGGADRKIAIADKDSGTGPPSEHRNENASSQ